MDDSIGRSLILLFALICAYAFFASSETAFSYANRIKIKVRAEDGDRASSRVLSLLDSFDRLLATILVGTNISNVLASSIATVVAVRWFGNVGSVYATAFMTLVIFLFAETIPKNIARKNSDNVARRHSLLIDVFFWLFTPVTVLFTALSTGVKNLLQRGRDVNPTYTEDEFQSVVETYEETGALETNESQIIQSAVDFSDIRARDIMIPLSNVVMVDTTQSPESIRELVLHVRYSRLPVCRKGADHILGVLQVRDCLYALMKGEKLDLIQSLRPTCFIHPDDTVDSLFEEMRHYRSHMAIVKDKGKTLGIVTMEDMLEELVGDIFDEEDLRPRKAPEVNHG